LIKGDILKTFIIAEVGINHNGSLENAFQMIDVAKEAGCDAAKFQLFTAKNLYPKSAGTIDWHDGEKSYDYNIFDVVEQFEIPFKWIDTLIDYCEKRNIDFMSTVYDIEGLNFLIQKNISKIKLSSYSISHIPLIEACAKTKHPIILSTGGATLSEVENALNTVLQYHNDITLLQCSICYPTKLSDCNLGVLDTYKRAFPDVSIGYSDHTIEISDAPVQSVYLGGTVIEKHITLDKKMDGPDHFFALEPDELKQMVLDVRKAEQDFINNNYSINLEIYGYSRKYTYPHEEYLKTFAYPTLFVNRPIKMGERILPKNISILRPGKKQRGLEPKYFCLFEEYNIIANHDMKFEDSLNWDDFLSVGNKL